jgi:hypothetical protein
MLALAIALCLCVAIADAALGAGPSDAAPGLSPGPNVPGTETRHAGRGRADLQEGVSGSTAAEPAAEKAEAAKPEKPAAEKPAYEPTSAYDLRQVEGWPVYVHKGLLEGERKDLGDRAQALLASLLQDVRRRLPAPAVRELQKVRFWLEAHSADVVCACYHPSRRWLEDHGFNPEKARGIEIGRPENFLAWTHQQPAMVIHELAHAYHHQVLGYDQPDIKAAYERAKAQGIYEKSLCHDGKVKRAYAMNNDQEYFAEQTEAYFSCNDFYPFVRAELEQHDPEMVKVLRKVWIERWKSPPAE